LYNDKFKQQNNHCINYRDLNGIASFGLIFNFLQVDSNYFCVIQRFETVKHDAHFLKALTSTCLKYIDKFFVKTKETKLFMQIHLFKIKDIPQNVINHDKTRNLNILVVMQ
jgi:hypothetical protein